MKGSNARSWGNARVLEKKHVSIVSLLNPRANFVFHNALSAFFEKEPNCQRILKRLIQTMRALL